MIRPFDVADNLSKTPLVEKVQHADKIAAEGQQKYLHADLKHLTEKQINTTQPTHEDEQVENESKRRNPENPQSNDRHAKKKKERGDDPDEKEMTNLGRKVDVTV